MICRLFTLEHWFNRMSVQQLFVYENSATTNSTVPTPCFYDVTLHARESLPEAFHQLLVLYVPILRQLFRFSYLHVDDLAISLASGVFSVLWFEALKVWQRRKSRV